MAESELAVLASQYLDRRIPDKHILIHQVAAWEADRNAHQAKADWQFREKSQPRNDATRDEPGARRT